MGEGGSLRKGASLMAAPSGLTRFTTSLRVTPRPLSGPRVIFYLGVSWTVALLIMASS